MVISRKKYMLLDIQGLKMQRNLTYRLKKALYGLKQDPRAWYDTLRDFLISKGYKSGSLDPTLFTIRYDDALFICQIYVDDIIFGCTNKKYSEEFAFLMSEQYQM